MILALAGNPNCGKTTLFNALTGANARTGNFPGVTVTRSESVCRARPEITLVDLPGVYALRPYSDEERVTRSYLLGGAADAVISIADATCPARSLYLTLQLLELGVPVVLALNVMDALRAGGGSVDTAGLARALGIPVVPVSAALGEGLDALLDAAVQAAHGPPPDPWRALVSGPVQTCVRTIARLLAPAAHAAGLPPVFAGVGSVAAFLPVILALFFFLSLLEDTGYLARVAFVMDRPLRRLGLSGQSAVPLLLGFGCSVPGVLAARTLPTRRDRALTIVLTPCMSCSAKAPVYAAFAAAFFPGRSAVVFLALYALGILAAAVAARLLGRTALRGEAASFVMELPDYRWPNARSVLRRMWVRTREFLTRAFTVILAASVGVWVLRTFTPTWRVAANAGESLLAVVGQALAPVFAPLGFGDWRAATALVTGLLAKETVLSTLGVLLGGDLTAALPGVFSPAAAASYLVFTALYAPCVAAQAAMRQELGSRLGTLAAAAGSCAAAWCAAAVVYRIAILI